MTQSRPAQSFAVQPPPQGWLEVISGPMFSAKSDELIGRLRKAIYRYGPNRVSAFRPALDTREPSEAIVSRSGASFPAITLNKISDLPSCIQSDTHVVGMDEAQFFGGDIMPVIHYLLKRKILVYIAVLERDCFGDPFGQAAQVLCLADHVTKLTAICQTCGLPASHTYRTVENSELILIGDSESYEARCRNCIPEKNEPAQSQ